MSLFIFGVVRSSPQSVPCSSDRQVSIHDLAFFFLPKIPAAAMVPRADRRGRENGEPDSGDTAFQRLSNVVVCRWRRFLVSEKACVRKVALGDLMLSEGMGLNAP